MTYAAIAVAGVSAVTGAYGAYSSSQAQEDNKPSTYTNPYTKKMWKALGKPVTQRMANAFQAMPTDQYGLWQIPNMPSLPTLSDPTGLYSSIPDYEIPALPTYSNLSPDLQRSIEQPFKRSSELLGEQLGSIGQYGSSRGGVSGAGAGVLADYWGNTVAPQLGSAAYSYMMPAWQQQLGQNISGREELVSEANMKWQQQEQYKQAQYQQALSKWNMEYEKMMTPWTTATGILPTLLNNQYPIVNPATSPTANVLGSLSNSAMMYGNMGGYGGGGIQSSYASQGYPNMSGGGMNSMNWTTR